MLDNVFKNSRKFLGVPLAILMVVCIALSTGGVALASYLWQTPTVNVTVWEPLTIYYEGQGWEQDVETGNYSWTVGLYACENVTTWLRIENDASVPVPIHVTMIPNVVPPDVALPGVQCTVRDIEGYELTAVPAHSSMTVYITVSVDCDAPIPGGIESQSWTVNFLRG